MSSENCAQIYYPIKYHTKIRHPNLFDEGFTWEPIKEFVDHVFKTLELDEENWSINLIGIKDLNSKNIFIATVSEPYHQMIVSDIKE